MKAAIALFAVLAMGMTAALPAHAQLAAPGLGLDRDDLPRVAWGGQIPIKGLKPQSDYPAMGFMLGGVGYGVNELVMLCTYNCINPASDSVLPETLLPPFVSGYIAIGIGGLGGGNLGFGAQIFEPDQLKRKATSKESRAQLKQKDFVAIFLRGQYTLGGATSYFMGVVEGCKAQAELRDTIPSDVRTGKFKVSCKKDALDEALQDIGLANNSSSELARLLGLAGLKKKTAFDLQGQQFVP